MCGIGSTECPEAASDVNFQPEFIRLHVLTKKMQSIRDRSRWEDLLAEFEVCDCDGVFFTETWRSERREYFEMSSWPLIPERWCFPGRSGHWDICTIVETD